jgi:hypothetical protein
VSRLTKLLRRRAYSLRDEGQRRRLTCDAKRYRSFFSVLLEAVTGPVPTDARITPKLVTNGVSINGLHVALPAHMKSFPAELVPLP